MDFGSEVAPILRSGLADGLKFAVAGLGMQALSAPSRAVNFAQGDLMVLGSILLWATSYALSQLWPLGGFPAAVAIALALALLCGRILAWMASRYSGTTTTLALVAVSLLLHSVGESITGGNAQPIPITDQPLPEFLETLSSKGDRQEGLAVVLCSALLLGLLFVNLRQRLLRTMAAFGSSPGAYRLWGQSGDVVMRGATASVGIGLLGGVVLAPFLKGNPYVGLSLGVHGFILLMLARNSAGLCVALAIGWGVAEHGVASWLGHSWVESLNFVLVVGAALERFGPLKLALVPAELSRRLQTRVSARGSRAAEPAVSLRRLEERRKMDDEHG